MLKKTKNLIIFFLVSFLLFGSVKAANDKLPDVMVGKSTVTASGSSSGGGSGSTNASLSLPLASPSSFVDIPPIVGVGASDLLVSAWIKLPVNSIPNSSTKSIIGAGRRISQPSSDPTPGWAFGITNNPLNTRYMSYNFSDGTMAGTLQGSGYAPLTSPKLDDGNWHFIAFVWQKTQPRAPVSFYADGTQIDSRPTDYTGGSVYSPLDVNIGDVASASSSITGIIDDVSIYSGSLATISLWSDLATASQVINAETKNKIGGQWPVAWYTFNTDTTGSSGIHDLSGNAHNGTVKNSAAPSGPNIITVGGTSYFGFAANEVVLNYGDSGNGATNDLFGFNESFLGDPATGCSDKPIPQGPARCFYLSSNNSKAVRLMNSKTSIDGTGAIETAALAYGKNTVVGDVYGSFNNFAFWGKSMNQNPAGVANSSAAYGLSNYPINTNAQASWTSAAFASNDSKITTLKNEAPFLNAADTGARGSWYLQSANDAGASSFLDDSSVVVGSNPTSYGQDTPKTPEGKVWRVNGDLTINSDVTYSGVGTIIVDGNLTISGGVDIKPANAQSRLGFIVYGNTTISGTNKVQAAIYCKGAAGITINGNSSEFTGSFVAPTFGGLAGSNIRFYYDYNFDEMWPPGFRYLNMPHAEAK